MASFTWLVVGKLSSGVPNAIRPQVSLLPVGQLRLIHMKPQRIQEQQELGVGRECFLSSVCLYHIYWDPNGKSHGQAQSCCEKGSPKGVDPIGMNQLYLHYNKYPAHIFTPDSLNQTLGIKSVVLIHYWVILTLLLRRKSAGPLRTVSSCEFGSLQRPGMLNMWHHWCRMTGNAQSGQIGQAPNGRHSNSVFLMFWPSQTLHVPKWHVAVSQCPS